MEEMERTKDRVGAGMWVGMEIAKAVGMVRERSHQDKVVTLHWEEL